MSKKLMDKSRLRAWSQDTLCACVVLVFTMFVSAPLYAQGIQQQVGRPNTPAIEASKSPEPKPEQQRPTRWGEPTKVGVEIHVIDVDAVDSANQNFSASVYVEAHWDMPVLRHKGPAPAIRRTTEVWTPKLVLVNQQQAWTAFPSYVEISPEGEVTYRQKFWGWFSQPLNLHDYPFDRQTLTIHLVAAGMLEKEVKLVPLLSSGKPKSSLAEKFSLPDFEVTGWKAAARPYVPTKGATETAGFAMDIEVRRLPSYYIWKIIFPLCFIVIMSWIPRWLDAKENGTNINISTTAFLTLVAYLFSIAVLLPRVPYLTRLDSFVLLSSVLVFAGLLHTVISARLLRKDKRTLVGRLNRIARIANPVLLVAVLVVSFA